MCNCRTFHFVETVRRFCLHHTGHQIPDFLLVQHFEHRLNKWEIIAKILDTVCSVTLRWPILFFLYYFMFMYSSKSSFAAFPVSWKATISLKRNCHLFLISRNLFDLILIFLFHRTAVCLLGSLCPINNLSVIWGRVVLGWTSTKLGLMCLAQGHNTVTLVKFESATPPSRVKFSTTEPLRSPNSAVTMRRTGPAKCPRGCT